MHEGHRARVKKRFLEEGLDHFSDIQALELLLFTPSPGRTPIPSPTGCWSTSEAFPRCWRPIRRN